MENKYAVLKQHERLRVPEGWKGQNRSMIIQLNRILDDIYQKFGRISLDDLSQDLRDLLDTFTSEISDLDSRLDTAEDNISTVTGEVSALYGLTVNQLKGK